MESNNSRDVPTIVPTVHVEDELSSLIAMTIYLALLAIFGLVGNVLVIISVVISPQLRNTSYTFIVNLSIADLSVNVLVVPTICYSLFHYGWPRSPFWCQWISSMFFLTTGISLLMLMVIAFSRNCLVSCSRTSYNRYCGWKGVAVTISVITVGTSIVLVLIPVFTGVTVAHYDPGVHFCYLDNKDDKTFWYTSAMLIYGALTCFLLIPFLYYRTFRTLNKSKRRLWAVRHAQSQNDHNNSDNSRRNQPVLNRQQYYMHPAEVRLTKMSALIFMLMAICWIPLWTVHFCRLGTEVPYSVQRLGVLLVLTNSSINPYIYAWLNKRFLRAYKRILLCRSHPQGRVSHLNL
ncbi:melatonin receptor type 1B-like [Patiria miniata]|uniref:G-protein coupled receptors family 1 profile domain-containing protein n=1 Tax=Patiria miniata TaxID=46514 RepID=A0A914AJ75_PATMI|nr:melatonin receptor type 1B-like [Patiria miniata]